MSGFENLLSVVRALRGENGCPWDKAQTPLSLRRYMIEECFETIDAITQGEPSHVKEELGDLFFNVLLDACIYEENGDFTVDECLSSIAEKLVRRHPHVFPRSEGASEANDDLGRQWDDIKAKVEGRSDECALASVPDGFPPLLKAQKMLSKAAKRGFEWEKIDDVRAKVTEEMREVDDAAKSGDGSAIEEEIGDLLLSVVNWARWLGVDAVSALDRANRKFSGRFGYVESSMRAQKIAMDKSSLGEMMRLWREAKKEGR